MYSVDGSFSEGTYFFKERLRQEIDSVKHAAQATREGWDKVKRDRDERYEKTAPEDGEDTD